MVLSIILIVSGLHYISGLRLFQGNQYDHVQIHHVEGHIRQKRSNVFHFPDKLSYRFNLSDSSPMELNLSKVRRPNLNTVMWMATDNGKRVKYDLHENKNIGLYQDWSRGSSIMVMCENNIDTCKLYGTFYNNTNYYNIQASDSARSQLGLTHMISKIDRHDNIIDYLSESEQYKRFSSEAGTNHISKEVKSHDSGQRLIHRRKRTVVDNVIELLFYLDSSVFDFFMVEANNIERLAIENMRLYYILLQNEIDLHFQSFVETDPTFAINVLLNDIVFSRNLSDFKWIENNLFVYNNSIYLDMSGFSNDMGKHLKCNEQLFDETDHVMQFTRFDVAIREPWFQDTAGFSRVESFCGKSSFSLVEDPSYGGVSHVATHELGHSLGALHDVGSCNVGYVMGGRRFDEATKDHLWKFSPCSITKIKSILSNVSCANSSTYNQSLYDEYRSMDPTGSYNSIDKQCKMTFGLNSVFQPEKSNLTSMCYTGVACSDDGESKLMDIRDGTTCDIGKTCYRGDCVSSRPEPPEPVTSKCKQGKFRRGCAEALAKHRLCRRLGGSFCRNHWLCH